jgi:hypothetical protein
MDSAKDKVVGNPGEEHYSLAMITIMHKSHGVWNLIFKFY